MAKRSEQIDKNGKPFYTLKRPKIRSRKGVLTPEWIAYLYNVGYTEEAIEVEKRNYKMLYQPENRWLRNFVGETEETSIDKWEAAW